MRGRSLRYLTLWHRYLKPIATRDSAITDRTAADRVTVMASVRVVDGILGCTDDDPDQRCSEILKFIFRLRPSPPSVTGSMPGTSIACPTSPVQARGVLDQQLVRELGVGAMRGITSTSSPSSGLWCFRFGCGPSVPHRTLRRASVRPGPASAASRKKRRPRVQPAPAIRVSRQRPPTSRPGAQRIRRWTTYLIDAGRIGRLVRVPRRSEPT